MEGLCQDVIPFYHAGTLVSDEWVVTAANIFQHLPIQERNFEVLLGATLRHIQNVAEGMIT